MKWLWLLRLGKGVSEITSYSFLLPMNFFKINSKVEKIEANFYMNFRGRGFGLEMTSPL